VRRLFAAALLAVLAGTAAAHDDTPLHLATDGNLQGLPSDYAPARLALGFSPVDDERRLTALHLQLGQAAIDVPACILGLIHAHGAAAVQLRASWTHDESVVPYYLAARFAEPDDADVAFTLLFNLHTARLIEVSVDIAHGADVERSLPLDLRARCATDELDGVLAR